ncbi:MAG TPA: NAD(P)-dependent alcohol dehydrogenase [Polyangiaceae bacterium]|nr:NAD(P)-dependent alcohol dehydrogenase [Polyangiaceae bacterium]
MRVLCLRGGFGLDRLVLEERPEPTPGTGEVLLRMRAASLNFRDVSLARGTYDPKLALPVVLGSDGVGEVVRLGHGVTRFALGERACPIAARGWYEGAPTRATTRQMLGGSIDGTFCELLVAREGDLVRPPPHLTDAEAATLGVAGVTAYRALFELAGASAARRVLVIGTGGVATFAVALARAAGAEVAVVSRSAPKLERALALGAHHGVNATTEPEWGVAVRELAGGDGVDLVVELGGAATLGQSLRAVRAGGTVALIGHVPDGAPTPSLVPVVMREVRVQGVLVGPRASFEALAAFLERTAARPVVDRVFSLDDYRLAFDALAAGSAFGKTCFRLATPS